MPEKRKIKEHSREGKVSKEEIKKAVTKVSKKKKINEMKLPLPDKLIFLLVGFSLVMLGVWTVDVSVSGMLTQAQLEKHGIHAEGVATSGWWQRDLMTQYHIGLYLIIAGSLFLISASIYWLVPKEKKEKKD